MTTAEQVYNSNQALAKALLDRLAKAVDQHAEQQKKQPANWGFKGDLDAACGNLIQALGALGALTEAEQAKYRY